MYLVIFSAVLYGLAFIWPHIVYWFIFCSLGIVFYVSEKHMVSFVTGFVWGAIAFGMHLSPLLRSFLCIGEKTALVIFAWLFLVGYAAFHSSIWFFLLQISSWYKHYIVIYIGLTWGFFWWIDRCFLWIFDGALQGYCCIHPMVVLICSKAIRHILYYINAELVFVWILICIALISLCNWRIKTYCIVICVIVYCLSSKPIIVNFSDFPEWMQNIGWLALEVDKKYPGIAVEQIYNALDIFRSELPEISLILMPESTFPYCINKHKGAVEHWSSLLADSYKAQNAILVFGTHRCYADKIYNACYGINDNGIVFYGDKNRPLFFAECLPVWYCQRKWAKDLFLADQKAFAYSQRKRCSFDYNGSVITIFICSEFFFAWPCQLAKAPGHLLCLLNDAWFKETFLPELLFLSAKLKALSCGKNIIYIAHSRGMFINAAGESCALPTIPTICSYRKRYGRTDNTRFD